MMLLIKTTTALADEFSAAIYDLMQPLAERTPANSGTTHWCSWIVHPDRPEEAIVCLPQELINIRQSAKKDAVATVFAKFADRGNITAQEKANAEKAVTDNIGKSARPRDFLPNSLGAKGLVLNEQQAKEQGYIRTNNLEAAKQWHSPPQAQ